MNTADHEKKRSCHNGIFPVRHAAYLPAASYVHYPYLNIPIERAIIISPRSDNNMFPCGTIDMRGRGFDRAIDI